MKKYDILKELEKLDEDDFEPGFLSELQQQAPVDLHSRIMNSIREEALKTEPKVVEIKPRHRFNYRKYASFTAAAAVLAIAFIGGADSLIKSKIAQDHKPATEMQGKVIKDSINPKTTSNDHTALKEPTSPTTANVTSSDKTGSKTSPAKTNASASRNLTAAKDNAASNISGKTSNPKVAANKTQDNSDNNGITVETVKKKLHTAVATVGTGTNPDNKPVSGDTGNSGDKPSGDTGNTANSGDTKNPDTANINNPNPTNQDPSTLANEGIAYYDGIINYEISLNLSQTYVIQFIKEKCISKISDSVYRLSSTDFNTLNKMLDQNNIPKNKISDPTDQTVIIKMITY